MNKEFFGELLDTSECHNEKDIIEISFKAYVNNLKSLPQLFGKPVIMSDHDKYIKQRPEAFWHMISLNKNDMFNTDGEVLPCANDNDYEFICRENCNNRRNTIRLTSGPVEERDRNICFYRAKRILWLIKLIEAVNQNHPNTTVIPINIKTGDNRLAIRYYKSPIDYVAILVEKPNYYLLITCYPVFYPNAKKVFAQRYLKYLLKK